jgi:RNA-directed DNA polymerase
VTARGATCRRRWALDADLAAACDQIDHAHLLGLLGSFPARERTEQWLQAGGSTKVGSLRPSGAARKAE